ncbi:Uma2 family endonuclease [Streptomonospora sediminis]
MELCERSPKAETDPLREMAERIVVPEGSKVEILGGRIHVSAAPTPKHNLISDLIEEQLMGRLTGGRRPSNSGFGVAPIADRGDYTVPDLIVTTMSAIRKEAIMLPAAEVDLAVEVVSKSNANKDLRLLPVLYAAWQIPVYLLVDPRTGDITLHSAPRAGAYEKRELFRFGDVVELPQELDGIRIETIEFPRYDSPLDE